MAIAQDAINNYHDHSDDNHNHDVGHFTRGRLAKTDMGWGPQFGTWDYRILTEPDLSETLASYANTTIYGTQSKVHSVSFQPCLLEEEASQDRCTSQEWHFPDGVWTFSAVFDGKVFNYYTVTNSQS